jgi:uncharacterized protein
VKPVSFLIPVLDQWLWYAPLHGAVALINGSAARCLREDQGQNLPAALAELRALSESPTNTLPNPLSGDLVPSTLGIIPTRGCNMRCLYCNFGAAPVKEDNMRTEIAVAAVDWAAQKRAEAGETSLHIQFFGGEPFVAPSVIEIVVERARQQAAEYGLQPYFDASTNGLFSERLCHFIGDHFDAIVLSLDGPPEYQDRYRPLPGGRASSAIVQHNAHALSKLPLELCLRLCVTDESVVRLGDIARWMIETFQPAAINFEPLTASDQARRGGIEPPDPYVFARAADEAFAIAEAAGVQAIYAATETGTPRLSLCPVGRDVVIVSPDGRLSACYLQPEEWRRKGLDLDIGTLDTVRGANLVPAAVHRVRWLAAEKDRCARCFCQYTCAGGCHVNLVEVGRHYPDYCLQTRVITATRLLRDLGQDELRSELLADRLAMHRLATNPDDVLNTRQFREHV